PRGGPKPGPRRHASSAPGRHSRRRRCATCRGQPTTCCRHWKRCARPRPCATRRARSSRPRGVSSYTHGPPSRRHTKRGRKRAASSSASGHRSARRAASATSSPVRSGKRGRERRRELETLGAAHAAETATTTARLEALAAENNELSAALATLEVERDRLAAEVDGAGAARVHLEQALERGLEAARAREQGLIDRLAEREHELERVRAEQAAEAAGATARLEALTAEGDQLRVAVAALETERDRLAAEVDGTAAARAHLERALARELEAARAREQGLN